MFLFVCTYKRPLLSRSPHINKPYPPHTLAFECRLGTSTYSFYLIFVLLNNLRTHMFSSISRGLLLLVPLYIYNFFAITCCWLHFTCRSVFQCRSATADVNVAAAVAASWKNFVLKFKFRLDPSFIFNCTLDRRASFWRQSSLSFFRS